MTRIADTVGVLAPSTLDIMNDAVKNLQRSKSPEELRVVLETLRTVLRRVTGALLTEEMLKEDEAIPEEREVATKTAKILDWASKELGGKSKEDFKNLKAAEIRYHAQIKMILQLINKPIHLDILSATKAQVERVLISVIVWMGDMIDVLDRAGYVWERV